MILRFIINIIGFNACWFSAVFGAREGLIWLGPVVAAIVIAVHLLLNTPAADRRREALLIALIAATGPLLDMVLALTGVLAFAGREGVDLWFYLWFAALWGNYAATINLSMRWLQRRMIVAAVLGGIAGSTTYRAAELIGAIELAPSTAIAMGVVAIEYAVAVPLTVWLARKLSRPINPDRDVNAGAPRDNMSPTAADGAAT